MLAHTYEPHRITWPCFVQPKLNGIRALYQAGSFQSRDLLPFPNGLLDHLARPLLKVFGPETILDGELYRHGWPLQRINAAVTPVRQTPTEDTLGVEFHVFDVVDFGKSFEERERLIQFNSLSPFLRYVSTRLVISEGEANSCYADWVAQGYEGMMYRLGDCPYTVPKQPGGTGRTRFLSDKNNRVWHMLKRKDWQDDEFVCVGVEEGEGKYAGTLGAFECEVKTHMSNARFTVGSGITDAERVHYWANPPVGQFIKVKYLCLSSAGIPLNPTILCVNPK